MSLPQKGNGVLFKNAPKGVPRKKTHHVRIKGADILTFFVAGTVPYCSNLHLLTG